MTLRLRLHSSLALLFAAAVLTGASALAADEQYTESARANGKAGEPAKNVNSPAMPPADDAGNSTVAEPAPTPPAPPTASPNAASPARDAAKPVRQTKQRPAWPPPPELIS
ncbi:MAG: hypothetical protein KF715_01210 [Candidatus Didemnitutus sp.]|nr:hypothetical protein [Candidatus Didemnitutus sp.]